MTEGCHGATIPCDTNGLTPCSDCCGRCGTDVSATDADGTGGATWHSDEGMSKHEGRACIRKATEVASVGMGNGAMPSFSGSDVAQALSESGIATGMPSADSHAPAGFHGERGIDVKAMEEFDEALEERLWDLVYEVDCDAELYNLLVWAFPDPAGRVEPEHRLTADEVRRDVATLSATGIPELERFSAFVEFWARQRF